MRSMPNAASSPRRRRLCRVLMPAAVAGVLTVLTPHWITEAQAQSPIRCGVDGSFAPHAMVRTDGSLEGFQIDLFREVARRMRRELVIENGEHAGMIPALMAGRYDFLCGPITVTPERSRNLIFTEPYMWAEWQFIIRQGTTLASEDDLRGQTIAVERGTPNERWLQEHSGRLNMTVLVFSGQSDAIQAVAQGRAFAYTNGSGTGTFQYIARRVPGMAVASWTVPGSRGAWAAPLRKDSTALRREIEDTIACMKKDGTLAALAEKWFGERPTSGAAEVTVFPGYGTEGFQGFDPTEQTLNCG